MVHTLEDIKGGGGSVKVGSTGTISALISREMNSISPVLYKSKAPKSTCLVPNTPKRPKASVSLDEASRSSVSRKDINQENHELSWKVKQSTRKARQSPMLADADNKRGSYMVEIVDIKCGNPNRGWANPITNRIKKLGFSKLSDNVI